MASGSQSQSQPSIGEGAKWNKTEVDAFVQIMLAEVRKGHKTTSTFNKTGWSNILNNLQAKLGRPFKMLQLRNKMNKLRNEYSSFKKLLDTTGFGWNHYSRTCTVEDEGVWDIHIKENPSWAKYRRHGLPQWPELQEIFGDSYANGDGGTCNNQPNVVPLVPEDDGSDDGEDADPNLTGVAGLDDLGGDVGGTGNTHPLNRTPSALRKRSRNTDLVGAINKMCDLSKARLDLFTSSCSPSPGMSPGPMSANKDYSVNTCITILDGIEGLDKELYLRGVRKIAADPGWREAFATVHPEEKRLWLLEDLL